MHHHQAADGKDSGRYDSRGGDYGCPCVIEVDQHGDKGDSYYVEFSERFVFREVLQALRGHEPSAVSQQLGETNYYSRKDIVVMQIMYIN